MHAQTHSRTHKKFIKREMKIHTLRWLASRRRRLRQRRQRPQRRSTKRCHCLFILIVPPSPSSCSDSSDANLISIKPHRCQVLIIAVRFSPSRHRRHHCLPLILPCRHRQLYSRQLYHVLAVSDQISTSARCRSSPIRSPPIALPVPVHRRCHEGSGWPPPREIRGNLVWSFVFISEPDPTQYPPESSNGGLGCQTREATRRHSYRTRQIYAARADFCWRHVIGLDWAARANAVSSKTPMTSLSRRWHHPKPSWRHQLRSELHYSDSNTVLI